MVEQKGRARFEAGPVTFIVQHELWDGNVQDHSDQGVAVLVAKFDDETTLLRFNCFDIEKSYIYGPEKENKLFRMDHTTDGNPINWTMQQIRNNLSIMLEAAGYSDIAKTVDAKQVEGVLGDVEAHAREVYATGRNTVKHHRGTDIFEVGNIRFGLEMRRQASGDGGLAIHVLADLAGTPGRHYTEETELLAFDCFRDAPHYHYGPRNKNHRIFFDKTLVPDTLGWTLKQFKSRKLAAMIDRAGYPGVASDLDQDLLDSLIPSIEKRAREMEAEGIPAEVTGNQSAG
ncbi:MAG TPA: hypothetical protein DCL97_13155 [Dehalococcoidia bacterium]|jgi:hypothetical protein|nr:hypothetical protein [Dehalococcoidia bacterium]HAI10022.1 hypothetical protein [Dehalococcoidia bacterium]HAJ01614.1 hypothetical protein [Dehalococcoidia bacterium]|tara:strand:- start:749 stop:1609 length:861 start_codon:yes stop_codon:yes gene_type:complete